MTPPKNSSLGRGLGELMGSLPQELGSAATLSTTGFMRVSPTRIRMTPEQEARSRDLPAAFLDSVRSHGILQPLLVRKHENGLELVAGAMRLAAARSIQATEIPVVVIGATAEEALELSRHENEHCPARQAMPPPAPGPCPRLSAPPAHPSYLLHAAYAAAFMAVMGIGCWMGSEWTYSRVLLSPRPPEPAPRIDFRMDTSGSHGTETPSPAGPPVAAPAAAPSASVPPDASAFESLTANGWQAAIDGNAIALTPPSPMFSYRTSMEADAQDAIRRLATLIASHAGEWQVLIEGHTDSTPMRGARAYTDNRDLGLARAAEVLRVLWTESKTPPTTFSITSAGADRAPFPSDTPESDRRNRTVTFRVTPTLPAPLP